MSAPAPGHMLISGVEYHDGTLWRLYVNNRWMWKYVLVDLETAKSVWRVYQTTGRLAVPIPEGAEILQVPIDERWEGAEAEKEAYVKARDALE